MTNEEFQKLIIEQLSVIKEQFGENTDIIKALVHRAEETDAQLHSMGHTLNQIQGRLTKTATKADIDSLAEDINFIMRKVTDHDSAIRELRRAE